jgi:hypothetical protein
MGVGDVADPVADRLGGGVLQGRRVGAEQAHAAHVDRLAPHVLGAHVDDAVQAEACAHGGGRHAVLAGAGLGDDPALAHAAGDERLAEGVVQLVRAGVAEVLALEVQPRAAEVLAEPLRGVQRGGAADEGVAVGPQFALEGGVVADLAPGRLQLVERRDQRLGDKAAAVAAEPALLAPHHGHAPVSSLSLAAGSPARIRASGAQRPRLHHLVLVHHEVLAHDRQVSLGARLRQVPRAAAEAGRLRQHRQGGAAGPGVEPGQAGGRVALGQRAGPGGARLHLGDHRQPGGPQRGRKVTRWRRGHGQPLQLVESPAGTPRRRLALGLADQGGQ